MNGWRIVSEYTGEFWQNEIIDETSTCFNIFPSCVDWQIAKCWWGWSMSLLSSPVSGDHPLCISVVNRCFYINLNHPKAAIQKGLILAALCSFSSKKSFLSWVLFSVLLKLGACYVLELWFPKCDPETSSSITWELVQSLNCVWLFATPWTAAYQASLSFPVS